MTCTVYHSVLPNRVLISFAWSHLDNQAHAAVELLEERAYNGRLQLFGGKGGRSPGGLADVLISIRRLASDHLAHHSLFEGQLRNLTRSYCKSHRFW